MQPPDLLAAVDLGSHSFHLLLGGFRDGVLQALRQERHSVRLAAGLRPDGTLDRKRRARALDSLARMHRHLAGMPSGRVRAVATSTFRRMSGLDGFQAAAEQALGHRIEVVSGAEEARLIWLGVCQGLPGHGVQRLLVDIGGGSTEFVIDPGYPRDLPRYPHPPLFSHSRQMGSVASTVAHFPEGRLEAAAWLAAVEHTAARLQPIAAGLRARGWQEAVGSSGTVRAIGRIGLGSGWSQGDITPGLLARIRHALLAAGRIRDIDLPGLSRSRRKVIAGGLVVLEAVFQVLDLERMVVCPTAMREGVLLDLHLQRQNLPAATATPAATPPAR